MRRASFLMVLICTLIGCSDKWTGVVLVVDRAGKPVNGATVTPIAAAIAGAPNLTNDNGEAHIDTARDAWPEAVSVSKGGFVATQLRVSNQWPLRITLARIADVP